MLEFFNNPSEDDAIAIIKGDHEKVKMLFERFEKTDDKREKKRIAEQAIQELKIHAEIEEKIFYPSVREDVEEDIMNEADEEHHVAKLLIAELDQMDGSEDHWEAKFTVLAENIRHHIREEEGEMLPQAREADVDFEAIGRKLLAKKQQLKRDGVPPSDEEKLMSRRGAQSANSPVRAAKSRTKQGARRAAAKSRNTSARRKATAKQTTASRSKSQSSQAKRGRR